MEDYDFHSNKYIGEKIIWMENTAGEKHNIPTYISSLFVVAHLLNLLYHKNARSNSYISFIILKNFPLFLVIDFQPYSFVVRQDILCGFSLSNYIEARVVTIRCFLDSAPCVLEKTVYSVVG